MPANQDGVWHTLTLLMQQQGKNYFTAVTAHVVLFHALVVMAEKVTVMILLLSHVLAVNTRSNKEDNTAAMRLTIEIPGLEALGRLLARISQLPNVIETRRERGSKDV